MANPAKLWEYVNTGKIKFSDLNEEGIKTFLDYGYKQGYIKESQLTDKAKILLGIRQPLSEQRKALEAKITPPSYLMGSPSSVLPQKVTQPKAMPSVGIEKRETLKAPPSYLMGSPSDILPKVEKIKEEEPKIEKPKKEVPLTQMAGSPRELMKELGYKLPETKEPSYSEVFTRSLAAGATETTGSLAKVGELIWEGSRRLWNLIVPESLETPEKNIIGEALKKTREFYEKSTQDYVKDMQGLKGLKKFINIGTMPIPQIAASAMMGFGITGIGAGGQLLRTGSRIPKEILRMIPFGTIATGGYAAEAEKEGANYTQQVLYGVLGGLGEMATESPVFEGWLSIIEKLGAGELVEAGARNIFQRYGKLGIEWLKNAAKESAQEAAMEPITMLAKRATYDPKAIMTMQQMAESAYGGFAMSTLLGALGLPAASLSRQMAEDAIRNGKQADTELIENIARQMKKDLENIAEVAEVVEAGFEPKRLSERISSRLGEAVAKDVIDAFEKGYIDKKDVIARAVVSTYDELMEFGYAEAKPEVIRQKAEEVLERKIDTGEIIDGVKQIKQEKRELEIREKPEEAGIRPKVQAEKLDLPIPVSKDDIPYELALNAYRWVSFEPEKRAVQEQQKYVKNMENVYNELKSLAQTDAQKEILKTELEKYRDKYVDYYKQILGIKSKIASPMITGPAKFDVKKNQKALDREREMMTKFTEWNKKAINSIKKKLKESMPQGAVDLEEYNRLRNSALRTIDTLKKIESGEMKGFNPSAFRNSLKGKLERSAKAGNLEATQRVLSEIKELQKELKKPVFADNNSIWKLLEQQPQKPELKTGENVIGEYDGAWIVENFTDDRVRIIFDKKPDSEVISELKRQGWKWSPSNNAWQRKLTDNAKISAKQIIEKYYQVKQDITETPKVEKEPWQMTRSEYVKWYQKEWNKQGVPGVPADTIWAWDNHKFVVEEALEQGKPVPEEVLKDYPSLLERVKTEQEKATAKKESRAAGKTLYRYYLTLRPPSPGAQPKGFINAVSFDKKKYVDDIGKEAWGYVEYDKPIENPEGWDMVPDKKTIASIEQTNVEELNKIEQEQRKEEAVKPKDIPEINVDFDSLPNTGFKKGQFQIAYPNGNKKAVKGYLYKDFGIQEGTKDITYIPAGAKIPLPNARNLSDVKRATKFIADMTEHISKDVSKFKEYILREKPEIYSLAKKIAKGLPRFRDIDKAEYMRSVLTPEEAKIYADYIERTGILEVGEKARQERPVQARQILKKDDMLKIEGELADKYILTQYWFIERSKAPKPLTNLYDKQLTDAIKLLETKTINKLLDNMKDFSPAVVEDVKDKYVVLRDKSGNTVRAIDKKYYDYFTRYGFEFGLKEGQDLIAITKNGEIAGVVISKRVPESAVERFAPKGGYVIRAEQPKLTKEKLISKEEVIRVIEESFGIPVRHGRYIGKALGIYKVKPEIIRTKTANDIYVVAHELGHHLQSLLDMPKKPNTKIADELKALARNVKGAPLKEGFSEFIRLYLTNEGIAQQTAPNLYNEFNQKITAFPEIGDAFDAVREAYKQYSGLSDLEKVQAHIVFDKPKPEQDTSFIDKFYAGCVDDLHMINKKFTELVQGRKVPVGLHPYFRAKLIKGLEGVVGDVLYRGVRDINKRSEIIGPAFKDIVGQFKTREELNDFAVYLVIKHAQELHDLGKKTGLEDVNLSEALNELDAKYGGLDKFEQSARQLYDFIDAVLRGTLLSSGIISQETYNILRKTYPLYVPFYRLMDDKQGTLSKGRSYVDLPQPIKRLKGSGRRILNPIETLILNTYTFYSIAERNNIARLFIEWEETLPGRGKLVEKVSPTLKPFTFKVEEIEKTLLKNTDLPPDAFAEVQDLTITLFRALHHSIPKENISTVFIDGQHVMYQFDPEIYDALKGMTPNTFGALIKILRPFTIMLRTGATKNLDFPFTNVIKDQIEATVFSRYGYIPILDFLRGVASYIKQDKYLSDYFASGAAHASIVSLDRDYLSGTVRKLARLPRTPGEIVMAPVEFLQAVLEGSEIPTRLGEFKRGIQKEAKNVAEERKTALENRNKYYELHQKALVEGRHPQEIKQLYAEYSYWNKVYNYLETYTAEEILFRAGVAAKEVTIDFTRIGKNVKDINAVRAFFNPSIQGIDKIARSFRENPKKMLFRVAFYIILPSLLAYLLNRDNEWYKERLRWEKDYYMHFPITADGKRFLRIPRGHMLGITFGALTQRFLEYIDQKDPEALDEIGETVMNELLLDLVPQDKFTLFKIGPIPIGFPQGLIPDGIKTAMEIYANMSTFTDTPIIPASEEHLEPFMQYGPYTPEILKTLGRTFGFSPRKVEHAIRGYTGGLGKNVLDILDFLTRPVGKETAPPEGAVEVLEDIPGIRRFIAQPLTASQSATINRFYKDYSRAETVYRTAKAYAERTGKPYIPKTKEDRELLQQYKTLERIRNNLSSIRKSIANIQNLADMPPKEKKEAIEKLNTLMIDLVREYYGKKKLR